MLAKIYRPAKNAMQSGKANTRQWVLEFEASAASRPEALMGWTSSPDASGQVRMRFDTKEQAIEFARAHGLPHQVTEPSEPKRIPRAYADNFAFRRREPWSH
ncbi:NADH-ubiquinone oxidoreductase-related protein [alpha proteobacterium U9-1i]|nr:NADH-ubiquinone oxidoreductase-related protein [alpha proteobacterium U9-1i]